MWGALLLLGTVAAGAGVGSGVGSGAGSGPGAKNVFAGAALARPVAPAAPAVPAAAPPSIAAALGGHAVLRRCRPPPLQESARAACERPPPDLGAKSGDETAEALLCYAWFDLLLRWCDAGFPLEPLARLLAEPLHQRPDAPICPHLLDALPLSSYQQTQPYVERLRELLVNDINCAEICYTFSHAKPICNNFIEGNNLFTSLFDQSKLPNSTRQNPSAKSFGKSTKDKPVPTASLNPESISKTVTVAAEPPRGRDQISSSQIYEKPSSKSVVDEKKDEITSSEKKIEEPVVLDKPSIRAGEKVDTDSDTNLPQIVPDNNKQDKIINSDDYDGEDRDEMALLENEQNKLLETEHEHEHASNDGSSGPHIPYSAKVNHDGEVEGGAPDTSSDSDTYRIHGAFVDSEDSDFFTYLLIGIGVFILGYVLFHNKNRVLGLLIEGRRGSSTRRRGGGAAYRKLDCTLEEAVSSTPPTHGPNIVY